jgi:predicted acylesterase/phospholipase RssA
MQKANFVFSGSGTLLPAHAGAFDFMQRSFQARAFGGTSGGGLVALCLASGMSIDEIRSVCTRFLSRKDLLDLSLWPFSRYGFYSGDKIRHLLGEVFGKRKMIDLNFPCRIVVCDLWTRSTEIISAQSHPDALCADVARATMAIPIFFKASRIGDSRHLYVDGGTAQNFALGMFDDDPSPTIGVRIVKRGANLLRPIRNPIDYASAIFDLRSDAAEDSTSNKPGTIVVDIVSGEDALRFGLTKNEIEKRWAEGIAAARKRLGR